MRAVLDTNVLVRAVTRPASPAREVLLRVRAEPHTLITSPFLLTELYRVLNYPRIRQRTYLSDEEIREVVDSIEEAAEVVDSPMKGVELTTDPDDNPIVQMAVAAPADVLCTLDRHFHEQPVQHYCREQGLKVLTDVELLGELRAEEDDAVG